MVDKTLLENLLQHIPNDVKVTYAGIGTNKNVLDKLGPMVGSMLKEKGHEVYGTIEKPMHALTIPKHADEINSNECVIAIDICDAPNRALYSIHFQQKPIRPGAGIGKELPAIGHFSIIAVVDKFDVLINNKEKSHHTIKMANNIVDTIERFEQIRNEENMRKGDFAF